MENNKKQTFKEIHGQTRLGKLLKDVGPDLLKTILNVAGGLVPGAKGVADTISGLIKTSDQINVEQKELVLEAWRLDTEDIQHARKMYIDTDHIQADAIADNVIKFNLPVIGGLVIVNIAAVMLLKDEGEVIAIVSNFIGIAMGHLFNERQSVINFFFGSSRGSKLKDRNQTRD
jgi:uncharacterized protein (DUF697 family)